MAKSILTFEKHASVAELIFFEYQQAVGGIKYNRHIFVWCLYFLLLRLGVHGPSYISFFLSMKNRGSLHWAVHRISDHFVHLVLVKDSAR